MTERPFEFDSTIRRAAWRRQRHRCALCGVELAQLIPSDNCHHVIPDQAGDPDVLPAATRDFMSSVHNAVVLCDPCHRRYAHPDGRTKYGEVPFFGHYRFSHGPRRNGDHVEWLTALRSHATIVWPRFVPHAEDFPLGEGPSRRVRETVRRLKRDHWDEMTA